MTKLKAIKTIMNDENNHPTIEELNEAKTIIDKAIDDGYVLVPAHRLMKLLETFCAEGLAKMVFLELTK